MSKRDGKDTWVGTYGDWANLKGLWGLAVAGHPTLPVATGKVALVLIEGFNHDDGRFWIGFDKLVDRVHGAEKRTVQRALSAMEAAGLLEREGGFRGRTMRYRIAAKFVREWREKRVSPETERVSPQTERVSPQPPDTLDTTSVRTSDATIHDAPCGALSDGDECEAIYAAIRHAAGICPPFSTYWSDEWVRDAHYYWVVEFCLDVVTIVGAIREVRRSRPRTAFNSPRYFDDRMRDIAARQTPTDGAEGGWGQPTAEDHLAAVVGRELATSFVGSREEIVKPLTPGEALLIADKLRTYDDPARAMEGVISAGGSVPIEDGHFGLSDYSMSGALRRRKKRVGFFSLGTAWPVREGCNPVRGGAQATGPVTLDGTSDRTSRESHRAPRPRRHDERAEIAGVIREAAGVAPTPHWLAGPVLDAYDRWTQMGMTLDGILEAIRGERQANPEARLISPRDFDPAMRPEPF